MCGRLLLALRRRRILFNQIGWKAMKNLLMLVVAILSCSSLAFGQTMNVTDKALEATIINLDKQGWEAWKANDATWFKHNATDDFVSISSDGISSKHQVLKSVPSDCKVKTYSLADIKFVMLDKHAVLLTYTATQDAVCDGKQAPVKLQVAVNYVRH
jgi:hypothetical protein